LIEFFEIGKAMALFETVETTYRNFKTRAPPTMLVGKSAGAVAAWMDFGAAICGLPCSDQPDAKLMALARLIAFDFKVNALNADVVQDALSLSGYPFRDVIGVSWPFSLNRMVEGYNQPQMRSITKGDLKLLTENTERHLLWKAEIAARHGGDYKSIMTTLMNMADAHQGYIEARDNIRMHTEVMQLTRRAAQMQQVGRR
jgi:hypothetical protein